MKNEKELENIKEEIKNLNTELQELSDDELSEVTGGRQELQRFAQLATIASGLSLFSTTVGGVQTEAKAGAKVVTTNSEDGLEAGLEAEVRLGR